MLRSHLVATLAFSLYLAPRFAFAGQPPDDATVGPEREPQLTDENADAAPPAEADPETTSGPETTSEPATEPEPEPEPEPPDEEADSPPKRMVPKHTVQYNLLTPIRLNPLGVEARFDIGYRYRLYDTPGLIKDGSYVGIDFSPTLSPAITRVGPTLTIQPLALLRFKAFYGVLQHFGTFQFMQSYDSPYDDFSTTTYKETKDRRYAGTALQGQFNALLQAKAGPIAIRNEVAFFRTDVLNIQDNDGDGVKDDLYYSIRNDMLVPANGWYVTNDSDLLYLSDFGLTAGVRGTLVHAFYPDSVYEPGDEALEGKVDELENPNGPTFRVGPLIAYTFFDRPGAKFNRPSILLIANWWVRHRYRVAGSAAEPSSLGDSRPAMPYIVLGFACTGELWGRNKK